MYLKKEIIISFFIITVSASNLYMPMIWLYVFLLDFLIPFLCDPDLQCIALGVTPGAVKNHLGALEITLESGRLSMKLQSLILEQKVERGDIALHIRLRVRSLDGSIIGCDLKKLVLYVLEKQQAL
jgi:hypothetical protein